MTDPIASLHANRGLATRSEVLAFDAAIAAIAQQPDPTRLGELLLVFTDTTDAHEVMWGLVHLVESFEARAQLDAMIEVLPTMEAEAPEWVRILQYRILNAPEARAAWAAALIAARDRPGAVVARGVLAEIGRTEDDPLRSSALAVLEGRG